MTTDVKASVSKPHIRLLIFAVTAVGYLVIANSDTLDLPEYLSSVLRVVSLVVSFVGGLLFFTAILPAGWMVYKLIRQKRVEWVAVFILFVGVLYAVDLAYGRYVFLDIARDRAISRAEPIIDAIEQYRADSNVYPTDTDQLVPLYLEHLPKPSSHERDEFKYENLDSTYRVHFTRWVHGRTCRTVVYVPVGELAVPGHARTNVCETGFENWYFYDY
jgi:hypothetical protein